MNLYWKENCGSPSNKKCNCYIKKENRLDNIEEYGISLPIDKKINIWNNKYKY